MIRLSNIFFVIIVPLFVTSFFSYLARDFQLDDALIYMRYIKNFHEGFGLVYNLGERFNGLTSPLFTYIILGASFLLPTLQITTIGLCGLFLSAAAMLGGQLFSKSRTEAICCSIILASFGYFYTTFGMETALFLMLMALSLYLYKIDSLYFVIALALLVITRSEGIFLAAVLGIDYLIKNKKIPDLRFMLIAAIIFITPYVFNYFYYGDFIPATGSAKIGQGQSGLWGEGLIFLNVHYLIAWAFSNSYMALFFFIGFAFYGAYDLLKNKIAIMSICFCLLLLLFYVGFNIPNYHWYFAPFFYFMLIFSCRGFWDLASKQNILILFILSGLALFSLEKVISFDKKEPVAYYVETGTWLKNNTPLDASIAMVEIGTVGWYSDREIIDILGLVNEYNADYIAQRKFYGWLDHYQPDYIIRHEPLWGHEQSVALLEKREAYVPVTDFHIPGLVLLKKSGKYSDEQIKKLVHDQ